MTLRCGIPGTVGGCSGNARRATKEVAPERRKRVAEHRALSNNIQATSESSEERLKSQRPYTVSIPQSPRDSTLKGLITGYLCLVVPNAYRYRSFEKPAITRHYTYTR
jgi:hypothetical protein